ncbi:phosphoribosylglycinamide formyltransferase [Melioribacter sp. Ez-97]|uniref:phosphoribosylglycinamide formyltransferase n=1 Tax=Melioribacter sp. Ez-97 TaxID=3423434 RepID=UPI003EDAB8D2
MINIAVFVSGRGSNFRAINEKVSADKIKIVALISNRIDCAAVEYAKMNNIPVHYVADETKGDFISYDDLIGVLKNRGVELIVLAGFLKKIPDSFVDAFENKIINIHPAILPAFGGKGMYGLNVHKAVFNSSAKVSGATIHFVDKIYDNGKIILQKCVDISDVKSPEEIAERVLKIEHEILPYTVEKFAEGKISIQNNRVIIAE